MTLGGVSGPQRTPPGPQLCPEDRREPPRTLGWARFRLCSRSDTLPWWPQGLQGPSLGCSPHSLTPIVPSRPQEASSRNLVTLRVDSNGFFLYWTGPNMVRAGAGAAHSGREPLPRTPSCWLTPPLVAGQEVLRAGAEAWVRGGQALAGMGRSGALGSHPVASENPARPVVSPGGGHTGHQFHQGHTDRPLRPPAQGERWGPGLSMGVRWGGVGMPLLTLGSNLLRTPRFARCWVLGALMPG